MISFIIWLVGAICCIWCIKDVWSKAKLDTLSGFSSLWVSSRSAGSVLRYTILFLRTDFNLIRYEN